MDNEDGPNFSYAYGGTSANSTPSWNPALRPDHEAHSTSEPIAKPLEPATEAVEVSGLIPETNQDSEDELPTAATAPAIHAHDDNGIFDNVPNSDDDFFDRYGSGHVPQSIPQSPTTATNGHAVGRADEEALVSAAQSLDLSDRSLEDTNGHINGTYGYAEHEANVMDEEAPAEHPAEHYEHQGETTLLEEAVNESAKVPLVADSEPAADDWDTSGEVFDLGGKPQDAPLETPLDAPSSTPHTEATGTTVGDNVIGNTTVGGNAGEDIDWGNADDQDFFGGGQSLVPQESADHSPGAHVVQNSEGKSAPGTDSMWDLALDDDFLPDNDDAAPPFNLDDEGFLEDEQSEPVQQPVQPAQSGTSAVNRYSPQVAQAPQPATTAYGLQGPQFADFSQMNQKKPIATPNVAYGPYNQPSPYQQQTARPVMPSSAQSFADKAKGGYSSPYDLPEDVVTTRRRPAHRTQTAPSLQPTLPPPRTSSMYSNTTAAAPRPPPPSNMSTSSLSPPSSSHSMQSHMSGMAPNVPPKPAASSKTASSDFFAELPITTKPKTPARYTPQQSAPQHPPAHHAPPQFPPKERTASWSSLRNEVLPDSNNLISQLQPPERLPVFPDQPSAPVRSNSLPVPHPAPAHVPPRYSPVPPPSAPVANSRYSPAPPAAPAANSRYSPAAPSQAVKGPAQGRYASDPTTGPPRPPTQPYTPRTSSPLAYHALPQEQHKTPASAPEQHEQHSSNHRSMLSADNIPRIPFRSPLEGVSETEEQGPPQSSGPPRTPRSETPPPRGNPSSVVDSPRRRANYAPQYQPTQPPISSSIAPPPRAHSESPSATMKQPLRTAFAERPASGHSLISPTSTFGAQPTIQNVANIIPHRRQISHDFDYIAPTDERAADPLERWKGYPIFKWGLGGTVITSFPKQIPRYGGGASMPMLKCSPGEVNIQSVKEVFPLSEDIAKFPGPLKAKGKKKDVLTWLGQRIETLENHLKIPGLEQSMSAEDFKRLEEKVTLWKIMRVLVDNDGHLEGNATTEAAVRKVLFPDGTDSSSEPEGSFATAADLVGVSRSNAAVQAEPIDPRAVEELRNHLTKGDREKAVWHAVDQRLWAHAMLLSSTLNKEIWKQVVQEFVQKEVKKIGRNNQALAVLYEIFAGNHEDCIDELVPASARAGFQMVSTDGAGPTQNALQGLDRWRETLCLVLSNRSDGDVAALLSLGKLLAGYGRVEAAHTCFVFARSVAHVSGVDDAQSDIVLVGADHRANPLDIGNDLEPVLLTEVYEFALSLSAQGGSYVIPHLQNYKLAHAYTLAEYGYRADAQTYCDSITAAMKSTTRISPYYNGSFIASLDDLSKRLSQSPKDGSSSWISKPSMDKVSSSLLSKFNSFIAGDDEDAASNHSGGAEVGPFAKIAGNTPTISPSHSSADLYGAYGGYGAPSAPLPAPSNSKYAPSNAYAPRTSLDQGRSRYEPQGRPSLESTDGSTGIRAASDGYIPSPQLSGPYTPSQAQFSPPSQRMPVSKSQSYSPLKPEGITHQPSYTSLYQPIPPAEELAPAFGGYQPSQASFDKQPLLPPTEPSQSFSGYEPPSMSYEPPTSSYEPPTNSYEPIPHEPYNPDEEDKSPVEKPKKKYFGDDDDDDDGLAARAAALKAKQKSEADRKADEAFRKAAEADAQKDKDGKKPGGGWLTGWFKKDPNAAPGPIKAKLGEENSFYYDPDLKKWVNKKAGATEATKPMATPPPPKSGSLSRSISGNVAAANHAMGLPSSLPHSISAMGPPSSRPPTSNLPRSSSMPPPMAGPTSRASTPGVPSDTEGGKPPVLMPPNLAVSGPPSRPGTGMSNASSIEDLIGAPQARKGTAGKKKKGGRYIDVMAKP